MNALTEIAPEEPQQITTPPGRVLLLTCNGYTHTIPREVEDQHTFALQRLERVGESGGWVLLVPFGLRLRNGGTTPEIMGIVGEPRDELSSALRRYRRRNPITPDDAYARMERSIREPAPQTRRGRHAWIPPAQPGFYLQDRR
jgi:hypothetical protein